MAESIESFVKKLKLDGVNAGKAAGRKIETEAKKRADRIVAEAEAEAARIVHASQQATAAQRARVESELRLATRDGMLKLKEAVEQVLAVLLIERVDHKLADADYLEPLLTEVVSVYARADATRRTPMEIRVPEKMRDRFSQQVLGDLWQRLSGSEDALGLRATLDRAGFAYRIGAATVEVDAESLTTLLIDMVSPEVGAMFHQSPEKVPPAAGPSGPVTPEPVKSERAAPDPAAESGQSALQTATPRGQAP